MIMTFLKEYTDTLLEQYAKEVLKRPLKQHEKNIFYLKNEFYVNRAILNAKDNISFLVQTFIERVQASENTSN